MEKRKIKMIAVDLDGTLLNDKKEFTHYSRKVLQKACLAGIEIVIATGRPLSGIPKELLQLPIRYLITVNGGRIVDLVSKETLRSRLLSPAEGNALLTVFEEYDTFREVFIDGIGYTNADMLSESERFFPDEAVRRYVLQTRKSVPDIRIKMKEARKPLDKIQAIFTDTAVCAAVRARLKASFDLSFTHALNNNIEVNPKGIHKAEALLFLANLLKIEQDEIMACGDGMNDLEMVAWAGIGIAPDNAMEEVKAAANYVTSSNNKHGIAKAIEKYVL